MQPKLHNNAWLSMRTHLVQEKQPLSVTDFFLFQSQDLRPSILEYSDIRTLCRAQAAQYYIAQDYLDSNEEGEKFLIFFEETPTNLSQASERAEKADVVCYVLLNHCRIFVRSQIMAILPREKKNQI